MRWQTRVAAALALATAALLAIAWQQPAPLLMGFTSARTSAHRDLEHRFLKLPSANRMRDAHRFLTDKPHLAGSPRDHELAEWTRDRFREFGLEDVRITTHDVLLPWPEHVSVEMSTPGGTWRASMREDPLAEDSYTQATAEHGLPYHAYSASGDVVAPVDLRRQRKPGRLRMACCARASTCAERLCLVRYSVPYSYRGFKALDGRSSGARRGF